MLSLFIILQLLIPHQVLPDAHSAIINRADSRPWLIWITSLRRVQAAQSPRNKRKPDVKRTTPHPPARFGSKNYFSFKILQREPPERASTGGVEEIAK
ncbi:hypothetical protein [Xenorhabdus bovienii]|uniref:hypothetical protein n=1 Tax=Xenorhabdus bovienii TaxID=40576 RepID=UPI003DA4165C